MPYIILKVAGILAAWTLWYFIFGIECHINGLSTRNSLALPFVGLQQDLYWLVHPTERPEGWPVLQTLFMHSLLVAPVVLACNY